MSNVKTIWGKKKKTPTKTTLHLVHPWHPSGLHDSLSIFSSRFHLLLREHFKKEQYFLAASALKRQLPSCKDFIKNNGMKHESVLTLLHTIYMLSQIHFVPDFTTLSTIGSVVNSDNGKILISVTSNLTMQAAHTAFSFGELWAHHQNNNGAGRQGEALYTDPCPPTH